MPGFVSVPSRPSLDLKMRNLVQSGRPAMEIELERPQGQLPSSIPSYSSMDRINGTVRITPQSDTKFDDLDITFEGIEKTYVDKVATTSTVAGRTTATHKFLRLVQPISPSALPMRPRVLKANETYSVPFTFVIPSQMLPRACNHKTANSATRQAHLQIPPSLGDPDLAGYGAQLLDDMSPDMARVSYGVKAQLSRTRVPSNETETIVEKTKKVRVKPAYEEQPPLNVDAAMIPRRRSSIGGPRGADEEATDYKLRAEKTIKKGFLKGKLGELVIESSQPSSLHVPHNHDFKTPVTTMTTVRLRFDPSVDKTGKQYDPPRLSSLVSKLKVSTFYATAPRENFPSRHVTLPDMSQGMYSETLQLASRCVASAQWTKHDASTEPTSEFGRRDSAVSTASGTTSSSNNSPDVILTPSTNAKPSTKGHFYTATLRVPIALPAHKHLVPTFHTCLISRVYALNLSLSIQGAGPGSNLSLRVPLQISAEGSPEWQVAERERNHSVLSAVMEEIEEEAWEVDEQLRPRSLVVNPSMLQQQGGVQRRHSTFMEQAPPGYDALVGVRVCG